MTIAGPVPVVYGNFTQTRFDSALPASNSSISLPTLADESPSPAPLLATDIHAMQIKGRAWSLPLLHAAVPAENTAMPRANVPPPAVLPTIFLPAVIRGRLADATATTAPPSIIPRRKALPAADLHLRSLLKSCANLSRHISANGENLQKYAGALRAIDALGHAIVRQQLRLPQGSPSHIENEGGIIAVDLDEAIHGLYTAVSYTKNAFANGFGALGEALTRDAILWANNPKAWLTQSAQPHGAADVTLAGIVTVALVPFALMALHAGIAEMRESHANGKILTLEVERSREFLNALDNLSASSRDAVAPQFLDLIDAARKTGAQQLEDLQSLQRQNRENGQIGAFSAMSGGAIVVKATLDFSAKIGGLAGGAAATTLATTVGAAGAILAPIAAASAVGLGAKMVIKSNKALKNFTPVAEQLKKRIESDAARGLLSREAAGKHNYLDFLQKKLHQRSHFFRDYAEKNKRFLLGSALYAGGAVTSFCLTAAALAGVGIALGPIGMGILVTVGIVGGLLMGRYSTQFLFGHGRMHRYENYGIGDDPELDRHFLGTIETFTDKHPEIAKTAGVALRAAAYRQAARRDELRQDFLSDVSDSCGKRYHHALSYSTDSDEIRTKRGGAQNKWQVLCATVQKKYEGVAGYAQAGMHYLDSLLHSGGHAAAKAAAHALRQENKPYLSINHLHDWLHEPANHPKQLALMHDSLAAQIDYLKEKTKLRIRMYVQGNNIPADLPRRPEDAPTVAPTMAPTIAPGASVMNVADNASHNALLEALAAPLARDVEMRSQAENLHAELARYRTPPPSMPIEPAIMARMTSRFLSLQCGLLYNPKDDIPDIRQSQAALAYYYLKEASGRYRNLRGLLVDMELQATRLAMKDTERLTPQSAAGTSRRSR